MGSIIALQSALVIRNNEKLGLPYVFFVPAAAIVGNIIIAFFFMPETFGLTIEEVREIYGPNGEKVEEPKEVSKEEVSHAPTITVDDVEEEDEKLPYYHHLRSQMNMELMSAIKQRKSVFAWPSAGGALQV